MENNLEQLFNERVKAKNDAMQAEKDKYIAIRDENVKVYQRFLDQISFLNNYGFRWKLWVSCNNGHDCCMPRYAWEILLINNTIATTPFESQLNVKEVDGELKARFRPTILGRGRYVNGQDKDGWFTAEQFVLAFS